MVRRKNLKKRILPKIGMKIMCTSCRIGDFTVGKTYVVGWSVTREEIAFRNDVEYEWGTYIVSQFLNNEVSWVTFKIINNSDNYEIEE